LVKIPEVQKQINKIDCGLYAIANAVEFCFTNFSGSLHIEFNQQLMQDHLISCLEKGQFSVFPNVKVSKKGMVKCKSSVVESNCEYGKADSIENMVGCDWKSGVKVLQCLETFILCWRGSLKLIGFVLNTRSQLIS
jgi:hypothetical protein